MNLLPRDGNVWFEPDFLGREHADGYLEALRAQLPWRQPQLRIFGRVIAAPRLESWHGDPGAAYRYSGLDHVPQPWTPALASLREAVAQAAGVPFNSVLVNLYRDGADSNGWHADDEPGLGERRSGETVETALEHGSLLVMSGRSQECWKHTVPKERRVREARINLTFRFVHPR